MKFNLTPQQLKASERSVYSQGGQDGVLEAIFGQINNVDKYCCEFGAIDGIDCSNTANLRLNHGWDLLLMDIQPRSPLVVKANITAETINDLIIKNTVSGRTISYLSIDVDGNDYWIWRSLSHHPACVTIEYNSKFKNNESYAIEYNPEHKWEGDDYYGASLLALKRLGEKKGYTLVYVVDRFDAVFVRNDLIDENYVVPTLDELLPEPIIAFDKVSNKKWIPL